MKSALRILKKVVLWTVAVVIVLVVAVYAVNSHDERLSPQAITMLKAPPNPYRPGDNLYLMLYGLHAPPGTSVIAAGQAAVRAYEAKLSTAPESFLNSSDKPAPGSLVFKGKVPSDWWTMSTLWREAPGHKAEIQQLLAANPVLYQRYLALHRATGYYETETPSAAELPPYPPSQLRHLFLANFALRMQSGNAAQQSAALADMADDLQIWRTELTGYGSIVSKMIAIAYLRRDFLLIGQMVADPSIALSSQRRALTRLVAPFPINVWKIGPAFSYEYRWMTRVMSFVPKDTRQITPKGSLWDRGENEFIDHFYKKNATENLQAISTLKTISIADGPPRNLQKVWSEYADEVDCLSNPRVRCLYNPAGKFVGVSMWIPQDEQYPLRAYDVAALQRMVKLAYEIRLERISPANIPRFMKAHPQWSTHPVDGKEFAFDPVKRRLSVERLAYLPEVKKHFAIPVWTPQSEGKERTLDGSHHPRSPS